MAVFSSFFLSFAEIFKGVIDLHKERVEELRGYPGFEGFQP